jgi:hypothetical protein
LRRLLRTNGIGSPRKRRPPAHRQRRLRSAREGELVQLVPQPTQFGRAFQQLGVTFIAAQSPQAKGRIERLWDVLQDRLSSGLRLAQACDLDSANRVLARFIADYNRRFTRTPRDASNAWRPAPENLERICRFTHERIVSNDDVVQWAGRRLQIHPQPRRFSFAGAKVQIYQALNGRVSLDYRDTRLEHSNLSGG